MQIEKDVRAFPPLFCLNNLTTSVTTVLLLLHHSHTSFSNLESALLTKFFRFVARGWSVAS